MTSTFRNTCQEEGNLCGCRCSLNCVVIIHYFLTSLKPELYQTKLCAVLSAMITSITAGGGTETTESPGQVQGTLQLRATQGTICPYQVRQTTDR